ncbi:hypothetical protein WJX74_003610 [Apatococcus lobatus]|uniref:Chromatin assembly factor 1 subunit A dimerization domain-containing protein n=1 Tax=Apatococcus lobatus TaxID=904363 RepID=A0AAW1R0E3_9CHLO
MAQVAPGPHALHSTTAATHISLSDTSKATDRKRKLEGQELAAFQQAGLASGLTTEPDQQVRSKQRLSTANTAACSSPIFEQHSPGNKENEQDIQLEQRGRPAVADLIKNPHQAEQLSRDCRSEACSIREAIQHHQRLPEAISCAPLTCDASGIPSHADLAGEIFGSSLPAAAVIKFLWHRTNSNSEPSDAIKLLLQGRILELADRKSFAAKQDSSTVQNILEDDNEALLWRWDLKDLKLLPKQHVRAAKERRKQWQQAQQRLNILSHANSALSGSLSSKTAQARLQKALDRIESVPRVLQARHAPSQGQSTDLTKEPATLPAHAAAVQSQEEVALPMELDQPATSSQKLAQQEAAAATAALKRQESEAKAAERACMKEEKAAEKQRMKNELAQEKEKAREKKAAEKAAELSSKKTSKEQQGFGDTKTFKKAQNVFKSFFRTPAKPAQASQDTSEQPAEAPVAAASQPTAGTSNQKPYHEIFRPPGADIHTPRQPAATSSSCLFPESPVKGQELHDAHAEIIQHWKAAAPRLHKRPWGLPPSWACRRGSHEALEQKLAGLCHDDVKLFRRKFLWHSADSRRPPLYGSFTTGSKVVSGRRPLNQDTALDYEVMSDEDWESEPEGEDVDMDNEGEADTDGEADSQADSFVVADGYLSESERMDLDDIAAAVGDEACSDLSQEADVAGEAAARQSFRMLEAAMERARAAEKPLFISALASDEHGQGQPGWMIGPAELLACLQGEVLRPDLVLTVPEDINASEPELPEKSSAGSACAQPKERPEDLLPELQSFLNANAAIKAVPKAAQAFMDAHPDRKMVKKWVMDKVKEFRVPAGSEAPQISLPDTAAKTEAAQRSLLSCLQQPHINQDKDDQAGSSLQMAQRIVAESNQGPAEASHTDLSNVQRANQGQAHALQ